MLFAAACLWYGATGIFVAGASSASGPSIGDAIDATQPLTTSIVSESLMTLNSTMANSIKNAKSNIFNKYDIHIQLFRAQVKLTQYWADHSERETMLLEQAADVMAKQKQFDIHMTGPDTVALESIGSIRRIADETEAEYKRVLNERVCSLEDHSASSDLLSFLYTEQRVVQNAYYNYNLQYPKLMHHWTMILCGKQALSVMLGEKLMEASGLYRENRWQDAAQNAMSYLNNVLALISGLLQKLAEVEVETKVAEFRYLAAKGRLDVLAGLITRIRARSTGASSAA